MLGRGKKPDPKDTNNKESPGKPRKISPLKFKLLTLGKSKGPGTNGPGVTEKGGQGVPNEGGPDVSKRRGTGQGSRRISLASDGKRLGAPGAEDPEALEGNRRSTIPQEFEEEIEEKCLNVEPENVEDEDLSRNGELFRSKLIRVFRLLESFDADDDQVGGRRSAQGLQIRDSILDQTRASVKFGEEKVQFPVHDMRDRQYVPQAQRARTRAFFKFNAYAPIRDYIKTFAYHRSIRILMLVVIVIDCICLGIGAIIQSLIRNAGEKNTDVLLKISYIFTLISTLCLLAYIADVVFRIMAKGLEFIFDGWLMFDIVVTLVSVLAEIITYTMMFLSDSNQLMYFLSRINFVDSIGSIRVLLSVKIITQYENTRSILKAIFRCFSQLLFVVILFFTMGYIFAYTAVMYVDDDRLAESKYFRGAFQNLATSYQILFQLLTNDHWTSLVNDYGDVAGGKVVFLAIVYMWLLFSAGILRQLFISIVIESYQSVRREAQAAAKEEERRQEVKSRLRAEMEVQEQPSFVSLPSKMESTTNTSEIISPSPSTPPTFQDSLKLHSPDITSPDLASPEEQSSYHSKGSYQYYDMVEEVRRELEHQMAYLVGQDLSSTWPEDTLFRYFRIMEALHDNLQERQRILTLINVAILSMNET